LRVAVAAGVAAALPALARAQAAWPSRPVRFVVPFAPGGSSEIVARATAVELTKLLGQSVYVENKPGGAGNVAMADVAAASDQHTLVLGHIGTLAVNPFIFDKLPYDPVKDFKPVSLLAKVPSLYVVHPDVPAKNLKEFVALGEGEAGPAQLRLGRQRQRRPSRVRVPEDGDRHLRPARAVPRHRAAAHRPARRPAAGRLGRRAGDPAVHQDRQAALHRHRHDAAHPQLPDVPTVAEQGWPGFEMTQWYGLMAPANLAQPALDKLAAAAAKAMRDPTALERLNNDAAIAVGGTPAEFAAFIAQERERWKPVIVRAKVKPD
jgi:tripartite-type tricarboxylate transporter receptor subunit TctC